MSDLRARLLNKIEGSAKENEWNRPILAHCIGARDEEFCEYLLYFIDRKELERTLSFMIRAQILEEEQSKEAWKEIKEIDKEYENGT